LLLAIGVELMDWRSLAAITHSSVGPALLTGHRSQSIRAVSIGVEYFFPLRST
jgi:hypothetical protein